MATRRRVCHITTVHDPDDTRVFHRECRSLVEHGYDVHLIAPCQGDYVKDGVSVHAIPRVQNRFVRCTVVAWRAMVAALRLRADIYHYHDPELMPIGFLLRWPCAKRVVFDIHESVGRQILEKHWIPRPLRAVASHIYRIAERCLTVGQELIVAPERCAREYQRHVHVVRNYPRLGVRASALGETGADARHTRLLIYVGSIRRDRGADLYLELAERLRGDGCECQVKLIGPYVEGYGCQLRQRIEARGLQDIVEVMGRLDHSQAMAYIARATIGLCLLLPLPNNTVGLSTKLFEYMMMGVPVLASDFESWRQYVAGEGAGLMVDPTDVAAVATACRYLLEHPAEAAGMGAAGRTAVEERYNWEAEAAKLFGCYDVMLRQGAKESLS